MRSLRASAVQQVQRHVVVPDAEFMLNSAWGDVELVTPVSERAVLTGNPETGRSADGRVIRQGPGEHAHSDGHHDDAWRARAVPQCGVVLAAEWGPGDAVTLAFTAGGHVGGGGERAVIEFTHHFAHYGVMQPVGVGDAGAFLAGEAFEDLVGAADLFADGAWSHVGECGVRERVVAYLPAVLVQELQVVLG